MLVSVLGLAASSASAQVDARVKAGVRVRLTAASLEPTVAAGTIASIERDTLVVDRGQTHPALRVALRDVSELSIYARSRGAQAVVTTFAATGFVAGTALYVAWCVKYPVDCRLIEHDEERREDEENPSLTLFAATSLSLALVGALIGDALAPQRWERIDLPLRIGFAPIHRGVAAYVSMPAPRFARLVR